MRGLRLSWQGIAALALCAAAIVLGPMSTAVPGGPAAGAIRNLLLAGAVLSMIRIAPPVQALVLVIFAHVAAWLLLTGIAGSDGTARAPFFLCLAAAWLLAWRSVSIMSALRPRSRGGDLLLRLLIPAIFGLWLLILWEGLTRGFGIPFILLPPPSAVAARMAGSSPILLADVQQTILKAGLVGYVAGNAAGFATAILADRFSFLRRGLLPIGNMVSALPIIGVAPIMVMWFGFGWESKAAVVIVMTFFPMLVNTVTGLAASGAMERDLMRTYASSYWQTLFKLRLPAAAPFIFNALKINSTLALIGAIVAEFFGTPVVGMGFRISTEVGRMNIDMVWAEIAVAALVGSVFYGVVALCERAATFWHPSVRGG